MQAIYADIQAEGAEVIAISTDNEATTGLTAQRIRAEFVMLSDSRKEAIGAYNANDPLNPNIALPQFYILDQDGIIRWKHIDVRKAGRLDPVAVLEALRKF